MKDAAGQDGHGFMNPRMRWLNSFVKWFFNASPLWVDEREVEATRGRMSPLPPLRDRRAANGERRRESRDGMSQIQRRRES
jgi:hypothetical protein